MHYINTVSIPLLDHMFLFMFIDHTKFHIYLFMDSVLFKVHKKSKIFEQLSNMMVVISIHPDTNRMGTKKNVEFHGRLDGCLANEINQNLLLV